ncbi:hypothetical protein [Desulfosediminicola flagellatus]|nr:hypothetical protein [Desulfosediminicola flagellatus]
MKLASFEIYNWSVMHHMDINGSIWQISVEFDISMQSDQIMVRWGAAE